ncbi:TOBE domain-containing protein [Crenobacter caeni]|uniref:LysR family transcriptional regulator n=1 Tax=Crenobacter caeni TaxID=2705474 RepID=A0A6B2KR26_9NEIS|nr:TOBE domain-containing protein [Crenobacter caeni]NDV12590.1 LysR family transcriptional regulator [Crenobacter caeni]
MKDPVKASAELWLNAGETRLAGGARIALLAQVGKTGSITRAAAACGVSYKGAWDAIDTMNRLSGEALVERAAGGKGGGGTRLTARGKRLVEHYARLDQALQSLLGTLADPSLADDWQLMRALSLRTSARNQLPGKVEALAAHDGGVRLTLRLAGGERVVAQLTQASCEALGLEIGRAAFALVKAPALRVAAADETPADNCLAATVQGNGPADDSGELQLVSRGGERLVASLPAGGRRPAPGEAVAVSFDAASVIVAVAG